jgi:hypothetical protein
VKKGKDTLMYDILFWVTLNRYFYFLLIPKVHDRLKYSRKSTKLYFCVVVVSIHFNSQCFLNQGYSPSPLDRLRGAIYGRAAVDWVIDQTEKSLTGAGAIGLVGGKMIFTPFDELIKNMDFKLRRPKVQSWEKLMVHLENLRYFVFV